MSQQPHDQPGQVDLTPEGGPLDEGMPESAPGAGQVRPTPEAGPLSTGQAAELTPPTLQDHMRDPILGLDDDSASATGTRTGPTTPPSATGAPPHNVAAGAGQNGDRTAQPQSPPPSRGAGAGEGEKWPPHGGKPVSETSDDVWRYAAPVVAQAEKLAIKAIDLSGRGLTGLARFLDERRAAREAEKEQQPPDIR